MSLLGSRGQDRKYSKAHPTMCTSSSRVLFGKHYRKWLGSVVAPVG